MPNTFVQLSVILLVITAGVSVAGEDDEFHYGKGMLKELPHERGELIKGFSGVTFPLTTNDETAKKFFLQGLAYLYMKDYREATRSFREVITRDPNCAMGYWGIALSHDSDWSLQAEYMWYAFERRSKVKTDLERDLLDVHAEALGTRKKPKMVLVDSETGKRRARPPFLGTDTLSARRGQLAKQLKALSKKYPSETELLPLFFLSSPRSPLAAEYMKAPPIHPLSARLMPWHKDARLTFLNATKQSQLAGFWNGVGLSFANQKKPDAALAFEAACRLDNVWLKKWDALPYERHGYFTHRVNLQAFTPDPTVRRGVFTQGTTTPKHPNGAYRHNSFYAIEYFGGEKQDSPSKAQRAIVKKLGPLWLPPPKAPQFKLPSGKSGDEIGLKDFEQPTIVVFYLGFGCIHCVQQLNELRPRYNDFKKAGIEIVAIGTDDVDAVKASILDTIEVDGPKTPFEILCDPKGDVFKSFHCWEEFKDEPLHGTFLIDSQGQIRWRDISEEPFMQTDFLLEESKRLLAMDPKEVAGPQE